MRAGRRGGGGGSRLSGHVRADSDRSQLLLSPVGNDVVTRRTQARPRQIEQQETQHVCATLSRLGFPQNAIEAVIATCARVIIIIIIIDREYRLQDRLAPKAHTEV